MTVPRPARHPEDRLNSPKFRAKNRHCRSKKNTVHGGFFLLALGCLLIASGPAAAQPARGRMLVLGQPGEVASSAALLRSAAFGAGFVPEPELSWLASQQMQVDAEALGPLRQTDRLITDAKRHAAELDEAGALRRLSEAERLLQGALAVPGAVAFYAEVQLQLGVTAAQLGSLGLAEAAFARAARLDTRRRLLAGEAAPEIVALAARTYEAATSAPEAELRLVTDPPAAHVYVDDVERGVTPLTLHARVGVHALRFSAAGRVSYGTLFDLSQGRRPEQRFVLAPNARALLLERLRVRRASANLADVVAAALGLLAAAPELSAVGWTARDDIRQRLLLFVCERDGCRTPLRQERGRPIAAADDTAALTQSTLMAAVAWLHAATPETNVLAEPAVMVWQQWYFWSALGAALLGAGVLAAVAAQPAPQHTLRVFVDPSALR
jgi:hypothetical protein